MTPKRGSPQAGAQLARCSSAPGLPRSNLNSRSSRFSESSRPNTSSVNSLTGDLPCGVSKSMASRMRLDVTMAPAVLDLRCNYRNLLNEMHLNNGQQVSSQYALMRPRRKVIWQELPRLEDSQPKGYRQSMLLKIEQDRLRSAIEETDGQTTVDTEVFISAKRRASMARSSTVSVEEATAEIDDTFPSPTGDESGRRTSAYDDIELKKILADERVKMAFDALAKPVASAKPAAEDEGAQEPEFQISADNVPRALRSLGRSTIIVKEPELVQNCLKAAQAESEGALDHYSFARIILLVDQQWRLSLQELFNNLDDDKSGTVNTRELRSLLWDLGFSPAPHAVDEFMAEADEDNSGLLEFGEFEAAVKLVYARHGFTKAEVAEFEDVFDRYDFDKSGEVAADELAGALGWLGSPATTAQAQELITKFDEDGNGDLGKPEFLQAMRHRHEEEIGKSRNLFAMHDTDSSGTIDMNELRGIFQDLGYTVSDEIFADIMPKLKPDSDLLFEDLMRFLVLFRQAEGFTKKEKEEFEEIFDSHDPTKCGSLREFEFGRALHWLGYPLTQFKQQELWTKVDVDKTGALEIGEFLKALRQLREGDVAWCSDLLILHQIKGLKVFSEPEFKKALRNLNLGPPPDVLAAALASVAAEGRLPGEQDVARCLRGFREDLTKKLHGSAGLADNQVERIRSKFIRRIEAGKSIEPAELERLITDIYPAAKGVPEEQTVIKALIADKYSDGFLSLLEVFEIVRSYADRRDEKAWMHEQHVAKELELSPSDVAQFREAFVLADDDQSGILSEDEAIESLSKAGEITQKMANRLRMEMDKLGDRSDAIEFVHFLPLIHMVTNG